MEMIMNKMTDVLGRAGAWCGQNKYLSAIKNAFQAFMPLTIAGSISVLWCSVLISEKNGLGTLVPAVMALDFLNPAFEAIQFATINCITIGITFSVAQEIGRWNLGDKVSYFSGLLGIACWLSVSKHSFVFGKEVFEGFSKEALSATGLFTGMIIAIVSIEIFSLLMKYDKLKIRMPEQVPSGIARSFEVMIPAVITLVCISLLNLLCVNLTGGLFLNDVIKATIQGPVSNIGATLPGVITIYIIVMLFWLVGIHGNNMMSAVRESLFTTLMLENMDNYVNGKPVEHIFAKAWVQMFAEAGGSGATIGLLIAIFIFGKREDNMAVAKLSLVPGIFNINETVTFGIPMVLNPILAFPFVLTPAICLGVGYLLTVSGFCPMAVVSVPWNTPPILYGFLATGASWQGAVSQLIIILLATCLYAPFFVIYERYQNKQDLKSVEQAGNV